MYTENNVRLVFLMLGAACNFKCRHCIQHEYHLENREINPRVYAYLKHLAAIRPDEDGRIEIRFWGGEPLLYWREIKEVVGVIGDEFTYSIISNGQPLNREMVDFFNEHDIAFVLSNDGRQTEKIRDLNMLEDMKFLELFKQVKNKTINGIIHAYNTDYYDFWEYVESKVPGCRVSFEDLICSWDMPVDIYNYDLKVYKRIINEVISNAHAKLVSANPDNKEFQLISATVNTMLDCVQRYNDGQNIVIDAPSCRQILSVMNLDLDGNVYACHNASEPLGAIEDEYSVLVDRYMRFFNRQHELSECKDCEFLDICRGGCPFSVPSVGKTACCERKKVYFKACMDFIERLKLEDVELEL